MEFNGNITEDSYVYKPGYIKCEKELNSVYSQIERLLRKKNRKLINKYDALKSETFCYEADEIYLSGLKDAISILKLLKVI